MSEEIKKIIRIVIAFVSLFAILIVLPFLVYSINKYFHHDRIEQMIESKVKTECLR